MVNYTETKKGSSEKNLLLLRTY